MRELEAWRPAGRPGRRLAGQRQHLHAGGAGRSPQRLLDAADTATGGLCLRLSRSRRHCRRRGAANGGRRSRRHAPRLRQTRRSRRRKASARESPFHYQQQVLRQANMRCSNSTWLRFLMSKL